jgi:NADPH:quinone reductase-like Zn-dependent oxidoreductase
MKAIVFTKSGSAEVLEFQEVAKPTPRAGEILVKVHAGTVAVADVKVRKIPKFLQKLIFPLFGFGAKDIWGVEVAGQVEEVGNEVTLFQKGDRVFGTTTGQSTGGNAEYICLPQRSKNQVVGRMPENISYGAAAALPVGGMTALQLLRRANAGPGKKILVYGASGSVGTYAVQIARHLGAEVTGVCSTINLDLVRSLGASKVIDYTREDFTLTDETYDIIFDTVGKLPRGKWEKVLKKNGVHVSVTSPTKETLEDLEYLIRLVETGELKPVIDREYSLEQVPEAHRYVETGRKRGNVVIWVTSED